MMLSGKESFLLQKISVKNIIYNTTKIEIKG